MILRSSLEEKSKVARAGAQRENVAYSIGGSGHEKFDARRRPRS
jgi:hypothetical protein